MKNIIKSLPLLAALAIGSVSCEDKAVPVIPQNPVYPQREANTKVIYEVNPRLFGSSNTLDAVTARLDEIEKLGVNVLWLMPIHDVGTIEGWENGSPYCVTDYRSIHEECGTLADLKELVNAAHAKGMKVIMDWVANHTAWEHKWITEHEDWYVKDSDGDIAWPENWSDVAELDYEKKDMWDAMIGEMKYWITEADIDGFRFDHVDGVPAEFWSKAVEELKKTKDIMTIAESSDPYYLSSGFDMLYAWEYKTALSKLFSSGKMSELYSVNASEYSLLNHSQERMRFITNHDQMNEKTLNEEYGSREGALAAFVVATYMGGVPMIYSSQEAGYVGDKIEFFYTDKDLSIDWNKDADYTAAYCAVMQAYHESAPYRNGSPELFNIGKVAAMYYADGLFVAVNCTKSEVSFKVPATVAGKNAEEMISDATAEIGNTETLGAYEYKIWKIEK